MCDKDFKFILIDKASHRHKFDNKLKDENPKLDITRVRVDIEDVVLKKIDDIDNHVSVPKLSLWCSYIYYHFLPVFWIIYEM